MLPLLRPLPPSPALCLLDAHLPKLKLVVQRTVPSYVLRGIIGCAPVFFQCVAFSTRSIFLGVVHLIAALMPILLVWLRPRIVPCLGGLHFDGHRRIRPPNVAISSNRCLTTHVTSVWFISRSGIHRHYFLGIVFLTSLFRVTFHLRHRTPPVRRYRSIYPVFVSSPLALSSNSLLRHQSPTHSGLTLFFFATSFRYVATRFLE